MKTKASLSLRMLMYFTPEPAPFEVEGLTQINLGFPTGPGYLYLSACSTSFCAPIATGVAIWTSRQQ